MNAVPCPDRDIPPPPLADVLRPLLRTNLCLVGLGNTDGGDDGAGMVLARQLASGPWRAHSMHTVLLAGVHPDRHLHELRAARWDTVLFVDATDWGGPPGALTLLDQASMHSRFPQVSTHQLSLGLIARLLTQDLPTQVYLLGIQPQRLGASSSLSEPVRTAVDRLALLFNTLPTPAPSPLLCDPIAPCTHADHHR
jgi:hydrogenase maturation protease